MSHKLQKCHHRNCKCSIVRFESVKCKDCNFYFCHQHFDELIKQCSRCTSLAEKEAGISGTYMTKKRHKLQTEFIESVFERERIQ